MPRHLRRAAAAPSAATPSASVAPAGSHEPSHAPSASPPPAVDHDANAKAGVDRFLGGEGATLPEGNQPLEPRLEGEVKVFELTIDEIEHRIDALTAPSRRSATTGRGPGRG